MNKLFLASALTVAGASLARADIIDFQHLEAINAGVNFVGTSVTEDGWLINKNAGEEWDFAVFGTLEPRYPGSTALFNNSIDGMNRLQHGGASFFDLTSIDMDSLNWPEPVTVSFTGFLNGGGTVLQQFTTDSVNGLETFNFAGFDNLTHVEWIQASPFHQYDNIVVNVVPEPASVIALLTGLGLLASRRRR